MVTKRNVIWRFFGFLNEEGRIFYEDKRFWFGVFMGALFVVVLVEVIRP